MPHLATTTPPGPAAPHLVQAAAGSYPSISDPRRRHQTPAGGSADYHLDAQTRRKAREQSRALERSNLFYDGFLSSVIDMLVGADGPEPMWLGMPDDQAQRARDDWWADAAAARLDASGVLPWGEWTGVLLRSVLRDGEAAVWRDGAGRALIYESEQVGRVQADPLTGRVTGMWAARLDRHGRPSVYGAEDPPPSRLGPPLPLGQTRLVAWRTRARQSRGAPACLAGLAVWERLWSLCEAEVISAESAALPWVVLNQAAGSGYDFRTAPPAVPAVEGDEESEDDADQVEPAGWTPTDAGNMMAPPPGVTATPWAPDRPNLNVPEFAKAILRPLCLPVLPYEVAFQDISGLSYAAVRGLGKLAQARARKIQSNLLAPALDPLAEDWLRARGTARDPAWRLEWRWPAIDIRDREKDASSADRELKLGLTSRQALLGADAGLIAGQRLAEQMADDAARLARIRALVAALASTPDLHWSQVLVGGQPDPAAHDMLPRAHTPAP